MDDMTTDTSPARRETSPSTSATSTTSTTSTSQTWTWSPTRLIADSAYLLVGFPLYLAAFIPIVVLLAVGGATMILAVGVPVVIAGLVLAQGTAAVERALQRSLLGARLPEPVVVAHPRDPGVVGQVTSLFRDRQRWGDAVFSLLAWAPTCVFWSVALSWWVTILAGLSYPAWQRYLPEDQLGDGMATWLNLPDEYWAHALCNVALGLMLLALAPIAMRGLSRAQAGVNGWLLEAPTRTLRLEQAHRRQLADTREGELGSLQRLERDIHDGAQQRLVRLQMDLARAERQWDRAPEAARGLLASATEQAHVALDDLRAATRGIAPPVLLDRGLAAALGRSSPAAPPSPPASAWTCRGSTSATRPRSTSASPRPSPTPRSTRAPPASTSASTWTAPGSWRRSRTTASGVRTSARAPASRAWTGAWQVSGAT